MKPPSARSFAKVPESILSDENLSHVDVRVYAALALQTFGGNVATVGQRRLAEIARVDRRTARASIQKLAKNGHISTALTKLLRRSVYVLHSAVFLSEESQRSGVESRPLLGVESRPRKDIEERGGIVSMPRRLQKRKTGTVKGTVKTSTRRGPAV